MAHGMARVKLMPRLLALVAAAAAIMLAAAAANAQTAPGTPGALIYGTMGSVTVDGTATNDAEIVATDANGMTFNAAWDTAGWSVEVTANSEISFTVNGAPVSETVTSGRAGSVGNPVTLVAVSAMDNGAMPGDDSAMPGDDGNGDDLLGTADDNGSMPADDGDDLLATGDDDAMPGDDSAMPGDDDAMPSDGDGMTQMPVGGTGGLLGQGAGTDAWVFGMSGVLVLLGLAGAFAAHRKVTHTA